MARSVIDSLVVTLGLDADNFTAGVAKASSSIAGLALKFTGMFLAIEGFDDAINYVRNLNKELTQLSFTAQNIGLGAKGGVELSRWGELAELAGGQAADAATSFMNLRQAVFGQQMLGQVSPSLTMLARMRVPYLNPNGTMRDPAATAMQLARNAMAQYPNDESQRYLIAGQAGFTGGVQTAIGQGPQAMTADILKAARDQKPLTEQVIDSQRQLYQSSVSLDNVLKSNIAPSLATLAPLITTLNNDLAKLVQILLPEIVKLLTFIVHPVDTLENKVVGPLVSGGPGAMIERLFGFAPRGVRNNNPLNLKATGGQARDAQGFAMFGSMAEGLMAGENQLDLYGRRGNNTISGIISRWASGDSAATIANYIKSVSGALGKSPNASITGADYPALMAAMASFEGSGRLSAADVQRMLAPVNVPAAARGVISSKGGAGAAAGKTTIVNIQSMNINAPQARDANGIAANMVAALRNKLLVVNADVGLA